MGFTRNSGKTYRWGALLFSAVLAIVFIFPIVQVLTADEGGETIGAADETVQEPITVESSGEVTATDAGVARYLEGHIALPGRAQDADLAGSSKQVSRAQAPAGSLLEYTIVISNSGSSAAADIMMTDALPVELTLVNVDFSPPVNGIGSGDESGGVITWAGSLGAGGHVEITITAQVASEVTEGVVIANTAEITGVGTLVTRTAETTITLATDETIIYMPVIYTTLPQLTLQVSRPNGANAWTASWNSVSGATNYQLQEARSPDFSDASTIDVGLATSRAFNHAPSINNEYYYRVRATGLSGIGLWSEPRHVIGGYLDDFTNHNSGWAIRRTTLLEEVRSWYEGNWFILQVEDSWDWGIAAPYQKKAPSIPYAIEYRAQPAHLANLVSHGAVFGADWPGTTCPDYSSVAGIYQHNLCFNHFYNTNIIWFGGLKLLFERVDYLEWRPQDGGSPMKRGSFDNFASWFEVASIPHAEPNGWNTWRVEVRADGIRLFVNGQQYAYTADTLWINEPYFGVFASTDEYSNSTWRFDYYQVMPLGN